MDLYDYRELFVVTPCYIAVLVLVISIIPSLNDQVSSQTQSYALTIGEDTTTYKIGDGRLSFTLYNNQGDKSSIYIYGLAKSNTTSQAQIFLSDLYSVDGSGINVSNILTQPNMITLDTISSNSTKVDISIHDSKALGNFQGWLMLLIGEDIYAVPITAKTDPLSVIAILWVTVGALISIGTWEIGRFFDRRKTHEKYGILNMVNPKGPQIQAQAKYLLERESIEAKEIRYNGRLVNRLGVAKFSLVNLFSIVFGIALFYIGLLSNPDVMGLQTISQIDIYSLIGIGLGIGSLGGFINKE